jgi:hypothetical protein
MKTLLGADAGDTRVYHGWPKQSPVLNSTYKAYIVYYEIGSPSILKRDDETFLFQIVSKDAVINENVLAQMDSLLKGKTLTVTGFTNMSITRLPGKFDLGETDSNLIKKIVHYRFAII